MFSSYEHIKRKTPEQGINRQEFIKHLVEEYYTTTNVEAQEQVTANLANFAYDPINWEYIKAAEVLKLFMELLETPNEQLQLHASADPDAFNFIVKNQNIKLIKTLLLQTKKSDIILNLLALFYQLLSSQSITTKSTIFCAAVLKRTKELSSCHQNDKRIVNISSLLLDEFGKRYELVEINTSTPSTTTNNSMAK